MERTYWEFEGGNGVVWVKEGGDGADETAPHERDCVEGRGAAEAEFKNFVSQESGRVEEGPGGQPQKWTCYASETKVS